MLESRTIKKINEFVYKKPRTIQEISLLLRKNWRTADRYVSQIIKEQGTLAIRTFRKGTRGALKVVHWNNIEQIHSSELQELLFKQIELGKQKGDFSPLDFYQYVDKKKKRAFLEEQAEEMVDVKQNLVGLLRSAQKQILFFSGNFSWVNTTEEGIKIIDVLEELAEKNVSMKALSRVDIASLNNIRKIFAVNQRVGKESIEIRHCEQPLRAFIIDNKIGRFKEIKNPKDYTKGELKKRTFIFYEILDEEWVEWFQKVFWNFFRPAVPAKKRLGEMFSIQKLSPI